MVVNYNSNAEAAEVVVRDIKAMGNESVALRADISRPEQIEELFQATKEHFQTIDIVLSNSGIEHFGALDEDKA